MREVKKVTGAVNFDDGRLLFELIEIDGVTHADINVAVVSTDFNISKCPL